MIYKTKINYSSDKQNEWNVTTKNREVFYELSSRTYEKYPTQYYIASYRGAWHTKINSSIILYRGENKKQFEKIKKAIFKKYKDTKPV